MRICWGGRGYEVCEDALAYGAGFWRERTCMNFAEEPLAMICVRTQVVVGIFSN